MKEPLIIMKHWHQDTQTTTYTVEAWPRESIIDSLALDITDSNLMRVDGDEVTFTVENGQATYRIDREEFDLLHLGYPMYLISSRLSAP